MNIELNSYGAFADWCEENNFDSETEWDIKHNDKDLYRSVSALASDDWGWSDVQLSEQEYERKVEQVVTEKVSYV